MIKDYLPKNNINVPGLSPALKVTGDVLKNYATKGIEESINNPSVATAVSGSGITDIFTNDNRLAEARQSIRNNMINYSDIQNNDVLLQNWNANNLQDNIKFDANKNFVNVLGNISKGAAAGAKFGGLFGGVVGGIGGAITGSINALQNQKNTAKLNKAIDLANINTINSFQDTATRNSNRDIRNDMMNMYDDGGDMTMFNVGGSHEQNPFGGIPQGIGSNGKPNLVEEGEVKYKFIDGDREDYIFPKRYKITESALNKVNLPTKYKNKSYADVAKEIQKITEENPNSEINRKTANSLLRKLQSANDERVAKAEERQLAKAFDSLPTETKIGLLQQNMNNQQPVGIEALQQPQVFAGGGGLSSYEDVFGVENTYTPESVVVTNSIPEEYLQYNINIPTDITDDYFRNQTKIYENDAKVGYNPNTGNWTHHLDSKGIPTIGYGINLEANKEVRDLYEKQGYLTNDQVENFYNKMYDAHAADTESVYNEMIKDNPNAIQWNDLPLQVKGVTLDLGYNLGADKLRKFKNYFNAISTGDYATAAKESSIKGANARNAYKYITLNDLANTYEGNEEGTTGKFLPQFSKIRYAPVVGAGIGYLTSLLQPADYSYANRLENLAGQYKYASSPKIGGYQKYTPYDINYQNSKTEAARQGMLRSATQSSNRANQVANMIGINNSINNQEGMNYLNWAMANDERRNKVDAFNLGINTANAELAQNDIRTNAELDNRRLAMLAQAAAARDASDTARAASISTTGTNFYNQLGNVGKDKDAFTQSIVKILSDWNKLTPEAQKLYTSYINNTTK